MFGKYADLAKTLHAVSWLNKVTYFSKENDGCECVEPLGICSWHTCSRNTSILLKNAFSWITSSHWEATLCTRVRERSQVRRRGNRTLHTCSRKEPSSPPGKAYFTHMFEKYGKLGVTRHRGPKVTQMTAAVITATQVSFATLRCFGTYEGYIGTLKVWSSPLYIRGLTPREVLS